MGQGLCGAPARTRRPRRRVAGRYERASPRRIEGPATRLSWEINGYLFTTFTDFSRLSWDNTESLVQVIL